MRMMLSIGLLAMQMCMATALAMTQGDSHPVDIYQSSIIDSLEANGVDSIVAIRYWCGSNGWNGYGQLVWKHNGETIGRYVEIVNRQIDHRLTQTTPMSDTIIGMAERTLPPTEAEGFNESQWRVSHDAIVRVRVRVGQETGEWSMRGMQIHANADRLRPMFINALSNPKLGYGVRIGGLIITDKVFCSRVKVVRCQPEGSGCSADSESDSSEYWCIEVDGRIRTDILTHEYSDSDKREFMRCLLLLEGDARRSGLCLHSVQTEALFLIGQLFRDPEVSELPMQESDIKRTFQAYRKRLGPP